MELSEYDAPVPHTDVTLQELTMPSVLISSTILRYYAVKWLDAFEDDASQMLACSFKQRLFLVQIHFIKRTTL